MTPGKLKIFNANGECWAWKVELNSNVLFSMGPILHSGETNLRAFGLGVGIVWNENNLIPYRAAESPLRIPPVVLNNLNIVQMYSGCYSVGDFVCASENYLAIV